MLNEIPAHVPTAEEMAEVARLEQYAKDWSERGNRALWDTDGFSLTAFVAGGAIDDAHAKQRHILDGGFGKFLILTDLAGRVLATQPEELETRYPFPRLTYKWVVRDTRGKMTRDESGKWKVYPYKPKRTSTLEKRGVREVLAALPYKLVSKKTPIGAAMKAGVCMGDLERVPVLED